MPYAGSKKYTRHAISRNAQNLGNTRTWCTVIVDRTWFTMLGALVCAVDSRDRLRSRRLR